MPWHTIDEFEKARDLLDEWKKSQRRVLKTRQDYDDMVAWGGMQANRRRTGTRSHNKLAPVPAAVLKMLAWRDAPLSDAGFPVMTQAQKAQWMSALCGTVITETDVKNAKRRGVDLACLAGSILELGDDDRQFLVTWFGFYTIAPETFDIAAQLCAPGSAAEAELDDLFERRAAGTGRLRAGIGGLNRSGVGALENTQTLKTQIAAKNIAGNFREVFADFGQTTLARDINDLPAVRGSLRKCECHLRIYGPYIQTTPTPLAGLI